MKNYKYLFGPVPSRRFGRSLGVDLTPHKTCSFDCVFCQLGRTTNKTLAQEEYVPVDKVIDELDDWFRTDGDADYVTLSGSGEPTLHSRFGDVIEFVRAVSTIPAVLLTNGSMLSYPQVRAAACKANIVKVSLSAWDQFSFQHINRPAGGLDFRELIDGQWSFRNQFTGELWVETFIMWGMNSVPHDARKIAELTKAISPDRVQLNTVVRPPAEDFVEALPREHMERLAELFDPAAEVIAEFSANHRSTFELNEHAILAMLRRRPCTMEEISAALGFHINEVSKYVGKLARTNRIRAERRNARVYYAANRQKEPSHAGM